MTLMMTSKISIAAGQTSDFQGEHQIGPVRSSWKYANPVFISGKSPIGVKSFRDRIGVQCFLIRASRAPSAWPWLHLGGGHRRRALRPNSMGIGRIIVIVYLQTLTVGSIIVLLNIDVPISLIFNNGGSRSSNVVKRPNFDAFGFCIIYCAWGIK
jgi:hypothetical protein